MLRNLLPKEVGFFDYFESHSALGIEVCRELQSMTTQTSGFDARAARINELEAQADN
jgi:hypothetical protein